MITINVKSLNNKINNFSSLIKEYELNKLNLFNQLKNICMDWYDYDQQIFERQIKEDELLIDETIEKLKQIKLVYANAEDLYCKYGNKIIYNSANNKSVFTRIEKVIDINNNIIQKLQSVSSYECSEKERITNEYSRMNNLKNYLNYIKDSYTNTIKELDRLNIQIQTNLNQYNKFEINKLSSDISEWKKDDNIILDSKKNVGIDLQYLKKDLVNYECYMREDNKIFNQIYSSINEINGLLNISFSNDSFFNFIDILDANRNIYYNIIKSTINKYLKTVEKVSDTLSGGQQNEL